MALKGAERAEVMYSLHGESPGNICGTCCNLFARDYTKRYYKCEAYGDSCSTATDWAKSYSACGLWGTPYNPVSMPLGVKYARKFVLKEPTPEIDGQINLLDGLLTPP